MEKSKKKQNKHHTIKTNTEEMSWSQKTPSPISILTTLKMPAEIENTPIDIHSFQSLSLDTNNKELILSLSL